MRTLLLAGAAVLALSSGAKAWDPAPPSDPTTINNGGVGGLGGVGGAGGAGGLGGSGGGGGLGGAGGVSHSASHAAAGASAAASVGAGAGSGSVSIVSPPGFALPSFGGGQCGIVGFGVGVSPSGGGAFGPAWESTNCAARINAQILISVGYKDQAIALLRSVYPNVEAAFAAAPVQPVSAPVVASKPDYCERGGWTQAQIGSRYPECR